MLDEAQPPSSSRSEPTQRIHVEPIGYCGKRVQIIVESYDEGLGWYTSGSLTLPISQLPLLEQSIREMHARSQAHRFADIIQFPKSDPGKARLEA